jgi:GAF domain-containing protein
MHAPAIPANERARLRRLEELQILDTPIEREFDNITQIASAVFGTPIALVSLVDQTRQWFKSHHGLAARQTPRDVSFCGHVVASDELLVVPDAHRDVRFADNPLVTGEPEVRFYAGTPLRTTDGLVLGTLCAIDHVPRALTPQQLEILQLLAEQTTTILQSRRVFGRVLEREATMHALYEGMQEGVALLSRCSCPRGRSSNRTRARWVPTAAARHLRHGALCPSGTGPWVCRRLVLHQAQGGRAFWPAAAPVGRRVRRAWGTCPCPWRPR